LQPQEHVGSSFIPALFATAIDDDFVMPSHTKRLHAAYAGEKELITFEGDHKTARPESFMISVVVIHATFVASKRGSLTVLLAALLLDSGPSGILG